MECTNGDKWNCKYCRKVESCEANKAGTTVSPPITVGLGDSERLEWLMRNVSGKEFRRLGVTYGGNCGRDRIDAAMKVGVGDTVEYRDYPEAEPQTFTTRTPAEVLSGHTAVVWLNGKAGCVCVDACRKEKDK